MTDVNGNAMRNGGRVSGEVIDVTDEKSKFGDNNVTLDIFIEAIRNKADIKGGKSVGL